MNHKIRKLLEQLDEQLKTNETEGDGFLNIETRAINISTDILGELKNLIIGYEFNTKEEEIYFFKHQKPEFLSRLIFHHCIYRIELRKPLGGEILLRSYLNNELTRLKLYFDENLDFYKYIRSESEYLDHAYFIRGKPIIKLCSDLTSYENDSRFCTSHGFRLATIIANSQIENYITLYLANLDQCPAKIFNKNSSNQSPTWKSGKTALVELIYALHHQGAIENYNSGLKGLILFFESMFKINLGNHYVTISEIKERKKGSSKFLDNLKETFVKKLEEENNN